MTGLKEASLSLLKGNRRTAVFAVTSRCNCKCIMCDLHKREADSITLRDAKKVLNFLAKNKFFIVYLTGGEPTLHPNIVEIVEYAKRVGLITLMSTNGTANKDLLLDLQKAGLYLLSVSLDHWDPIICEKIRKHKDIMTKQVNTIEFLKEIGLRTYALSFLNPFLVEDGVERLINYVNNVLGVPFGFCYPTKSDMNTYFLGSSLPKETSYPGLRKSIQKIFMLKKKGREVANLLTYIEDIVNFQEKKPPNFYCKGGEDVIYIDWFGDVYPCFIKEEKLFNAVDGGPYTLLENVKCNDCLINCFREPSFLTQMFHPAVLLLKEMYYSFPTRTLYK